MNNNGKFFDINTHSETMNPLLSAIFRELQNSTNLGKNSKDLEKLQKEHSDTYDKLQDSLNEDQKALYDSVYLNMCDEHTQAETECFNIGFKLCARLIIEVLR